MLLSYFRQNNHTRHVILACLILLLPFCLFLHSLFTESNNVLVVFGYEYKHNYNNNRAFAWYSLSHLIPALLLIIWFFTTSHSWRYFILAPLLLFINGFMYRIIKHPDIFQHNFTFLSVSISTIIVIFIIRIDLIHFKKIRKKDITNTKLFEFKGGLRSFYLSLKKRLLHIEEKASTSDEAKYLQDLFHTQSVVKSELDNLTDINRKSITHQQGLDYLFLGLLLILPLLYFLYKLVPDEITTYQIGSITIHDHGFSDVRALFYYVNFKILVLCLLSIWFITCKYWWRYAILSGIILYTYQLWEGLQIDVVHIDEAEYLYSMPYISILILVLFFLSKIAGYQLKILDLYENVSNEIEILLDKSNQDNELLKGHWRRFQILKEKGNNEVNAKEYLKPLLKLKKELIIEINRAVDG